MSITIFLGILHCHSVKLGLTEWGERHTASRLIYFSQQRVSGLSELILLLCKIFGTKFNTMSAVFATNCSRSCKYSILAEVYFEIKRLDK